MIFIKKIQSEKDGKEYFLISSCEGNDADIEIALLSVLNFKCYRGLLRRNYVKTRSVKMKVPYEIYLSEMQSALTHANPNRLRFVYNIIESDSDDIIFEWKKHVEKEELKILLGSISLSSFVTADLINLLFSNLSTELQSLYNNVEHLTQEQNQLKTEREDLLNTLAETNELKSQLETEMYAKFVVVLNSKKKKIKELKDQLEQYVGVNEKKRTINKQIESNASSENKEKKGSSNYLDIFSDEEVNIVPTTRIGRYISSNQQSMKKLKLEEATIESKEEPSVSTNDKIKMPVKCDQTLLDPDSDDLFDEL